MPSPNKHAALANLVGGAVVLSLTAASLPRPAAAQNLASAQPPALLDNMDGETPALRLLDSGKDIRVLVQSIERGRGRFGSGAERVRLSIPGGSSAPLAYNVPPAAVLEELRLAAWVSCNRPGIQLAASVVLPRSLDPQTGAPRRLLVRSGKPAAAGGWRQITLEKLPAELAAQARVARAAHGGGIDERGAYVLQVVLLAPGGPGVTELWVDQISMYGVLNHPARGTVPASQAFRPAVAQASAAASPANVVKPPAVPRIIQWQGEPLEMLQRIGFDAVWMGRMPTEVELAEATDRGMFIVCPPPMPEELRQQGLSPQFARVIAWDLGELAAPAEIDVAHRWAQALEQYESLPTRPVMLRPRGMTREASRIGDLVMLGRPTLGSTQSWPDYAAWLSQQRRLARAGTPVWASVETHCSGRFMAQLAALRGDQGASIVPATFNELSLATTAAFGVMPRGFCFLSQSSLANGDVENRLRRLALELTNLRLGLAEPWLAAGKAATAARSSQPDVTGLVLKVERSHLIVPLRWSDGPVSPAAVGGGQPLAFDLPGVPESSDAYLVSISGSERLRARRVTGGLRVSVDHLPDDAFLLVTEDGYAFSHVERYLRQHAPRAAQVRVELAALRRQQAAKAIAALPAEVLHNSGVQHALAQVDAQLTAVVDTMRRRDYADAFALAAEAERLLDESKHGMAAAIAPTLHSGAAAVPLEWSCLPNLVHIAQALAHADSGQRLLPGGEFESLEELQQAGWQRLEHTTPGVSSAVRLSPESPAAGGYCLELEARQESSAGGPPTLPMAPVWVTSPTLEVPAGHLIQITGMARVGEVPLGSPDSLLIFDSVGGEESAVRISSAPSWAPFQIVRAVPTGAEFRLTIALGGVGRAQIDSLAYRYLPINVNLTAGRAPRPGATRGASPAAK